MTIEEFNEVLPKGCRWVVLEYSGYKLSISNKKVHLVKCLCKCGTIRDRISVTDLVAFKTKSCGCLRSELTAKRNMDNRKYPENTRPLASVWNSMIDRCYNPNSRAYHWYGFRGVKVCDEWKNSYPSFLYWSLENGWKVGLQLDKDIKGDGLLYSPLTCKYVTPLEIQNNKRNNKRFEYNGISLSLKSICREEKINYNTVQWRLANGWSFSDAISKKIQLHKK